MYKVFTSIGYAASYALYTASHFIQQPFSSNQDQRLGWRDWVNRKLFDKVVESSKDLSPQNPEDIALVKQMIIEGLSLQDIRRKVLPQMWENKELVDLLIKQRLGGAIYNTFEAKNTAAMQNKWDDASFLLSLFKKRGDERVLQDHTKDSHELIVADATEPNSAIDITSEIANLLLQELCKAMRSAEKIIDNIKPYDNDVKSRNENDNAHAEEIRNCIIQTMKLCISRLHDIGVNLNARECQNSTLLYHLIFHGCKEMVKILVELLKSQINIPYPYNNTALYYAVLLHHPEIIKTLLKNGADPDIPDGEGRTPLCWTVQMYTGDEEIILILLENGADPNIPDGEGRTPLHYIALKSGLLEEWQFKLDAATTGHNKGERYGKHEWNPPSIAKLLLENGADPWCCDANGQTPTSYLIERNDKKMMKVFSDCCPSASLIRKNARSNLETPRLLKGKASEEEIEGEVTQKKMEEGQTSHELSVSSTLSTLISQIELQSKGSNSDAPFNICKSILGEHKTKVLYQHGDNLLGEVQSLIPFKHPKSMPQQKLLAEQSYNKCLNVD